MGVGVRIEVTPESGIPTRTGGVIVVRDHDRPTPPPKDGTPLERALPHCLVCERAGALPAQHFVKTYHVNLGADGTGIVSPGVWAGLMRCKSNPFRPVNEVPEAPAVHVSLAAPMLLHQALTA